jgi:hypothetical protein
VRALVLDGVGRLTLRDLGSDLNGGWTELIRAPVTSIVELGAIPVADGVLADPLAV